MAVFYNLPDQIVDDEVEVGDEVVAGKLEEITAARLGEGAPFLTDVLTEAYLDSLREIVETRRDHSLHRYHYAINIKVHSLGLTKEQRFFIYDDLKEMVDLFWRDYILPWIRSRKENEPDIYQAGRSGGWLVLDRPVVGDPKEDKHAAHWPEFHEARNAYRDVRGFVEGWRSVFKNIKKRLDRVIEEHENDGRRD